jgi:hypothetical protein
MVPCPKCEGPMMRVGRQGFMEEIVYPWTGRFPWICAICKKRVLIKLRLPTRPRGVMTNHQDSKHY